MILALLIESPNVRFPLLHTGYLKYRTLFGDIFVVTMIRMIDDVENRREYRGVDRVLLSTFAHLCYLFVHRSGVLIYVYMFDTYHWYHHHMNIYLSVRTRFDHPRNIMLASIS